MLMSDTWQPAVLHLLPFSTNDACNPRPPSSQHMRALPTPDHSRGFPVLAVTRRGKDGNGGVVSGSGGFPPGNRLTPQHRSAPARASSERLPRALTQNDSPAATARAKSEYNNRRNGNGGSAASRGARGMSRDPNTCSITDINERIMSRVVLRPESVSPDSATGSHSAGNSPFSSSTPEGFGNNGQGFPKPAFYTNGLSANGVSIGVPSHQSTSEGRYLVSGKNGLWRSVTMTPGEMELKKHREQLDRAQGTKGQGGMESRMARRYKLNVKDLPRSSTPVNDHDPDKLNMKQVIAFLQSKGKSQADAVQLPSDLTAKANPGFRSSVKAGVLRGRVHRNVSSSTAAEIAARTSGRDWDEIDDSSSPRTAPTPVKVRDVSENGKAMTSRTTASRDRDRTPRSWRSSARDRSSDRGEHSNESSSRKAQKPFRLHRFLTVMPEQKEAVAAINKQQETFEQMPDQAGPVGQPGQASARNNYTHTESPTPKTNHSQSARVESHVTKSSLHERTLCLDLAAQSRSQSQSNSKHSSPEYFTSDNRVQYRISAHRPSSLRVEQDERESDWKLSTDFGDRDDFGFTNEAFREPKNVIRLPYVHMDSEEEDNSVEQKLGTKTQNHKPSKQVKPKPALKKTSEKKTKAIADVPQEAEILESVPPSEASMSSSNMQFVNGFASHDDVISDAVNTSGAFEESVDSVSVNVGSDKPQNGKPQTAKRVRVNLPRPNDEYQVQGESEDYDRSQGHARRQSHEKGQSPDSGQGRERNKAHSQVQTQGQRQRVAKQQKPPECVTLSLRKERHRTREKTYMSEIGESDVFSDDTCAARVNSESVRMSIRSDDALSWAS